MINQLFQLDTSKLRITGDLRGNTPMVTGGFPSQRSSNVKVWYFLGCLRESVFQQKKSSSLWYEAS